ncbi:MAG: hypothetical protein VX581_09000 [Chloroflexota bacterium]|nr:hypothetical protein [Chloroflexota bacterium]
MSRVLEWLTLELLAAQAQDGAFKNASNDIIQELIARDFSLKRNMHNLRFIFNITFVYPSGGCRGWFDMR